MDYRVFKNILDISSPFKGILLDAYGVFWAGNSTGLIAGAKETMEQLVSSGKVVGVLSNSTAPSLKEIEKLQRHGLLKGIHFHFMNTSGDVAKTVLQNEKLPFPTPRKKFWLLGEVHPKFSSHLPVFERSSYLETRDINEADFIYVSIPHINGEDQVDPSVFREEVRALVSSKLPMVCTNPDQFAHEGSPPRAVVRQGSIAEIYKESGGAVHYIGKPSNLAYAASMEEFLIRGVPDKKEVLMVGDTPETDIRGAKNFGMPSALLTKTGIMADRTSHMGLDSVLKRFPASDIPDYFIERLAQDGI